MFSGSLRYNMDPLDEYTDEEIWTALEKVGNRSTPQLSALIIAHKVLMCSWGCHFSKACTIAASTKMHYTVVNVCYTIKQSQAFAIGESYYHNEFLSLFAYAMLTLLYLDVLSPITTAAIIIENYCIIRPLAKDRHCWYGSPNNSSSCDCMSRASLSNSITHVITASG